MGGKLFLIKSCTIAGNEGIALIVVDNDSGIKANKANPSVDDDMTTGKLFNGFDTWIIKKRCWEEKLISHDFVISSELSSFLHHRWTLHSLPSLIPLLLPSLPVSLSTHRRLAQV